MMASILRRGKYQIDAPGGLPCDSQDHIAFPLKHKAWHELVEVRSLERD